MLILTGETEDGRTDTWELNPRSAMNLFKSIILMARVVPARDLYVYVISDGTTLIRSTFRNGIIANTIFSEKTGKNDAIAFIEKAIAEATASGKEFDKRRINADFMEVCAKEKIAPIYQFSNSWIYKLTLYRGVSDNIVDKVKVKNYGGNVRLTNAMALVRASLPNGPVETKDNFRMIRG